jgi:DNA invertase Pin-like site-specific DNA recombinase
MSDLRPLVTPLGPFSLAASIDADEVSRLKKEGLGATAIAKRLKIRRASIYRVLESP